MTDLRSGWSATRDAHHEAQANELDRLQRRERFEPTLQRIFAQAIECHGHSKPPSQAMKFCPSCVDLLFMNLVERTPDATTIRMTGVLVLDEAECCALLRQTYRTPITYEGQSGPRLHALLRRIQTVLGPEKFAEFVGSDWPERLK